MKHKEITSRRPGNSRVASIDLFKFICAAAIVAIHISPFSSMSEQVEFFFIHVLFRVAVPFFCMTTGYFLAQQLTFEHGKLKASRENRMCIARTWKKNAKLYVVWSAVYLLVYIPLWKRIGWLSAWAFVDWGIAAVRSGSYYHLWYVLSLLYALPILWVCLTVVDKKHLPIAAVVLYLFKAASYGYRWAFPQTMFTLFKVMDALDGVVTACTLIVPYILLGMTVYWKQERKTLSPILLFGISLLMVMLEAFMLLGRDAEAYSYILFSMPTAYFFFLIVLQLNEKIENKDFSMLARSSVIVYCAHPAVNAGVEKVIPQAGPIRFAVVLGISFLLSILALAIDRRIKALKA